MGAHDDTGGTDLPHLHPDGMPRMVDVGAKEVTAREAVATGRMRVGAAALAMIEAAAGPKGSVLAVAALAGINGAKRTAELIPLCHNLPLDKVDVDFTIDRAAATVGCTATVATRSRTGVEMEALTAVHVALLTVHDMCKSVAADMEVTSVRVASKRGGKSGPAA